MDSHVIIIICCIYSTIVGVVVYALCCYQGSSENISPYVRPIPKSLKDRFPPPPPPDRVCKNGKVTEDMIYKDMYDRFKKERQTYIDNALEKAKEELESARKEAYQDCYRYYKDNDPKGRLAENVLCEHYYDQYKHGSEERYTHVLDAVQRVCGGKESYLIREEESKDGCNVWICMKDKKVLALTIIYGNPVIYRHYDV